MRPLASRPILLSVAAGLLVVGGWLLAREEPSAEAVHPGAPEVVERSGETSPALATTTEPAGAEPDERRTAAANEDAAPLPGGAVVGRVVDRDGKGVAEAELILLRDGVELPVVEAQSADGGAFWLPIPATVGDDELTLIALHRALGLTFSPPFTRDEEAVLDVGELQLEFGATLEGEALDAFGRPYVGMELEVHLQEPSATFVRGDRLGTRRDAGQIAALVANRALTAGRTEVDAKGRFRFVGLLPGVYELEIAGRNWGSGHRGVYRTGEFARVRDGVAVEVFAQGVDGSPLQPRFAQFRTVGERSGIPVEVRFPRDDGRGHAILSEGEYQLVVDAAGAIPFQTTLFVASDVPPAPVHAVLVFEERGTVRVELESGASLLPVFAARELEDGFGDEGFRSIRPVVEEATLGEDGVIRLDLVPGLWRVWRGDRHDAVGEEVQVQVLSGLESRVVLRSGT